MKITLIILIAFAIISVVSATIGYFLETMVSDADIANSWDGIDWSTHKDGGSE